jgi:hypothetical protein
LLVGRGAVGGAAIFLDDRREAVATGILAGERDEAAAEIRRGESSRVHALTAAISGAELERAEIGGRSAGQVDRPGKRTGPGIAAAAAAGDADRGEALGEVSGESHPAAERIGLRNPVEQNEGAARRISAEAAQGHALAGRMRRARIRTAELRDAGRVAEHVLEPVARGRGQPFAVDGDYVIRGLAGRHVEPAPGDDDLVRVALGERRRGEQKHADHQTKPVTPVEGPGSTAPQVSSPTLDGRSSPPGGARHCGRGDENMSH